MATKKITGQRPPIASKKQTSAHKVQKPSPNKMQTTKVKMPSSKFGSSILDEVILLLIMVVCIIVLVSVFTTKMGVIGHGISTFLKGMMGISAYFLPIIVIAFCIWLLSAKEHTFMSLKIASGILFLLAMSIFFHTLTGEQSSGKLWNQISYYYQHGTGLNGGTIGGMIGGGFIKAFNRPLTYLVSIVLLLTSVILATGKSFFSVLGRFLIFIGAAPRRKREKIKWRADQIRAEEKIREEKTIKKQERIIEKKQHKKGYFDIRLGEAEGFHAANADMPIVEAIDFTRKTKKYVIPKNETIYDYNKKMDPIPHTSKEMCEIQDDVNEVLHELEQDSLDMEQVPYPMDEDSTPYIKETELETDTDMDIEPISQEDQSNSSDQDSEEETSYENLAKETVKSVLLNTKASTFIKNDSSLEPKDSVEEMPPPKPPEPEYVFPPITLLGKNPMQSNTGSKAEMLANAKKLEDTLKSFGVDAKVIQINKGPTVTRYELSPSQGVKVSKIVNLADDIALNLAANGIRIEAPIPGKAAVGIEVPNLETQAVYLRDVIESDVFQSFPSKLAFALGQDISGAPIVTDIAKMPHLLIAGSTGSGKSVCINTMITSIIYKADPKEVKLILVDPKVVELSVYNGIPHLLIPVVTDPKKASSALNWAVREMLGRYQSFAEHNVRDIKGYNAMKKEKGEEDFMPQIVIIVDELADLMMAAPGEVEDAICRLAQMARAAGLHLIIATQRPSVDVITGLIKANIPSRLAFAVSSGTDSRTILDSVGAEKLLGKGDMLFYPVGKSKPVRIQGAFVTDKEVETIVNFVKVDRSKDYDQELMEKITANGKSSESNQDADEFLDQAIALVVKKEKASVSMLQRQFRIGYNRAARLMEDLENRGIVGPEDGSKPRKVLMSLEELDEYQESGGDF